MKKKIILLIVILILTIFPTSINAENREVDFSVKAVLPENQINDNKSYFDLKMRPAQEQDIQVIVFNSGKKEIKVKTTVYNATTNQNGIVVYNQSNKKVDSSLVVPLTEIVKVKDEEIVIAASESKTVTASIKMPKEEFDGIILGGLHFEKVDEEVDATSRGAQIKNKYAYVIGLQLSETNNEVAPVLNLLSVYPTLVNHRTAVVANIQNSEPVLLSDLTVRAEVFHKGKSEVLHESTKENIHMAPNSNMDFVINWRNQRMEEGSYHLKLQAASGEYDWEWDEIFTIGNEAKKLNKAAVDLVHDYGASQKVWYITGIGVLLGIIAILLFYIRRLKKGL